jgi:hypothetical protein
MEKVRIQAQGTTNTSFQVMPTETTPPMPPLQSSPPVKQLKTIMNSLSEIDLNSPVLPADPLRCSLQDLLNATDEAGLAHVPVEVLSKCVRPVMEGLRSIDAESLLELERATEGGATLADG